MSRYRVQSNQPQSRTKTPSEESGKTAYSHTPSFPRRESNDMYNPQFQTTSNEQSPSSLQARNFHLPNNYQDNDSKLHFQAMPP